MKSSNYFWNACKELPSSPLKKNLKKTLNFQSTLPEVFLKNTVLESLFYLACNFVEKTLAQLFFYKFCEFSEWLLLSIAIICQEYFKLNVRRIRATIFWHLPPHFNDLNISIHQAAYKIKAKPYEYISNHKAKFLTFVIWARETLENIFKVERLAHQAWG